MAKVNIRGAASTQNPLWANLPIGTIGTVRVSPQSKRADRGQVHRMIKVFAPKPVGPRIVSLDDPSFVCSAGVSKNFAQYERPIEILGAYAGADIDVVPLTAAQLGR